MRKSAYKKCLDETMLIPNSIPNFRNYFNKIYNPRQLAQIAIIETARLDIGALFDCELVEVMEYRDSINKK